MNVLVVTQYFWPENFRINDLVEGLQERGHSVTVLTGLPNYPYGRFFKGFGFLGPIRQKYKGAEIVRVPLVPRGSGSGIRLALNYLSFALSASLLAPFLCRGRHDLIFVFEPSPITVGLPALVLKRIKKTPILFWVQDLWPESLSATGAVQKRGVLDGVRRLVRLVYRHCDRILVTSKAYIPSVVANGGVEESLRYFPQSVEPVYRPISLEDDAPEDSILPPGFRVIFAGNIGAAQSFDTIVDAAEILKHVPDIKFLILGDGRRREWLENEVKLRGLEQTVHLLGQHPLETMPRFFSLADALLVTLKKDPIFSLTIPGKVQSYLACGKPIIAALDGEGARIISEAKAGLVCASEDSSSLADAILRMYGMTEQQRNDMGVTGLRYYKKHFDRDMLLGRLEDWMEECVDESRG